MRHLGLVLLICKIVALAPDIAAATSLQVSSISTEVGRDGLSAVADRLSQLDDPAPDELMALGGLRFLVAIETALQQRYHHANTFAGVVPILRPPLPDNPTPAPYDPELLERIMVQVSSDMAGVEAVLARLEDTGRLTDDFGLVLNLEDIWFDIDGNGSRHETGEGVLDLMQSIRRIPRLPPGAKPIIRFDASDISWLRAYAHLLGGVAEFVLMFDPTEVYRQTQAAMDADPAFGPTDNSRWPSATDIDLIASLLMMVRGSGDPDHSRAALAHFEETITHTRTFWDRVDQEQDNVAEWIPNTRQVAAIGGLEIPAEVVSAWRAVLDDVARILQGELLLSHWRFAGRDGQTVGVNLRRVFENPQSVDLVLWIQGSAAVPYIEPGPLADNASWRQFNRMLNGDGLLFAVWFN